MTMTNDNRFYLIIHTDIANTNRMVVRKCTMAALDPGVKIFQTVYGTDNVAYTIGSAGVYDDENDINKLDKLSQIATRMREGTKKDQRNGEKIYRPAKNNREKQALRKQAAKRNFVSSGGRGSASFTKLERKIKNKISDIHRKTAKFLCNEYDTIIITEFKTKAMATKRNENGEWTRKIIRWVRARGSDLR